MTIPDVERVIFQRSIWGRGYSGMALESKRRSAILFLRHCSKRGWVLDRVAKRCA